MGTPNPAGSATIFSSVSIAPFNIHPAGNAYRGPGLSIFLTDIRILLVEFCLIWDILPPESKEMGAFWVPVPMATLALVWEVRA